MVHEIENRVVEHYAHADLEQAILAALSAAGKDPDTLTPDDLSPVDEFHSGGAQATAAFAAEVGFAPGMHILDVGCGIGGPSRFFARRGCRVTAIDLTEDYVRTAEALARRVGLADRVSYRQASALALPFAPATFDGAYMMHVGMNIRDKLLLFSEVRRAVRQDAVFGIYDVMRTGEGNLRFPLHWASSPDTSFVVRPADYRAGLQDAGFEIVQERNRGAFVHAFFREAVARVAEASGPPALGIHLLMKNDVPQKVANAMNALEAGLIAPVEMICRAR